MTLQDPREHTPCDVAVVMGGSAGGRDAMVTALADLPSDYPLPILAVLHVHETDDGMLADGFSRSTRLQVVVPCDKQPIEPGRLYVAPANYHMLVERNGTIALSIDERVRWSRPSIDVLFESASCAWGPRLVAVLLSGANDDGARGLLTVERRGGLTIAQDPASAAHPVMPGAAISQGAAAAILTPGEIAGVLARLGRAQAATPGLSRDSLRNALPSPSPHAGEDTSLPRSSE